jgi:hypothetical protein
MQLYIQPQGYTVTFPHQQNAAEFAKAGQFKLLGSSFHPYQERPPLHSAITSDIPPGFTKEDIEEACKATFRLP